MPPLVTIRRLACGLAAGLLLVSCQESAQTAPLNVVLVLVDTLRADHLGVYGYDRDTSPHLDRFARDNVQFLRPRSQAACTFPSVNSLLTSRYPYHFVGRQGRYLGIPEGVPSLAERLQQAGYATAAISASPIVRATPSQFNPDGGFGRGFDHFIEACVWQPAACLNHHAWQVLSGGQTGKSERTAIARPFFLYLHYMEPHSPYRPPSDHQPRFTRPYQGREFVALGDPDPLARELYGDQSDFTLPERDRQHLIDLYDEEIAYFDQSFAVLLGFLDQAGLRDSTLVVVASDHGEEFLEHDHLKHCRTLFDASTFTPLLMRIPGVGAVTVPGVVENVDIVPTLLDYLGLAGGEELDGVSLRPAIAGAAPARQFALSSQGRLRAINTTDAKLIVDLLSRQFLLYDLAADPGEQHDRLDGDGPPRELARELAQRLRLEEDRVGRGRALTAAREATERLQSLGYLQ